jgi:hypothetical protein
LGLAQSVEQEATIGVIAHDAHIGGGYAAALQMHSRI